MAGQDESYPDRIVFYGRVSTGEQNLDLQKTSATADGIPPEMQFFDIESGRNKERPGLRDALKACRRGGTLVVWKLDRLGRNTAELIKTVERLHERGVNFRSQTQSEINTAAMKTATGQLIFTLFCALAQFESDQLAERTRAGMAAAKAKGKRFGRPTFEELYLATGKVTAFQRERAAGLSVKEIGRAHV